MTLSPGVRLGPYSITGAIGAGGMGEVYRAHDTKLNRDVAIKVLPEAFAHDHERLARFTREAQTLASLNHPNIAAIYGIEETPSTTGSGASVRALVMELVEGEDLSTHIARGPIPIAEALPIARQIAEALEAAHEHGVIHRDLKPGNIKVRADGTVKVLDFGLAKVFGGDRGETNSQISHSPTMSHHATVAGLILGTAAYMSPEQAKGKAVDRRADIWAFGVVVYEMLTGKRAFEGEDVSETLASVLKDTLSMDALPGTTPPRLKRLIERCLDRDPKTRLRDIGEARIEIARIEATAPEESFQTATAGPAAGPLRGRERTAWAVAGVSLGIAAILLAIAVWSPLRPRSAAISRSGAIRFTVGERLPIQLGDPQGALAWSRDGKRLLYTGARDGSRRLFLRSLSEGEPVLIPGTEGASAPFFSPDGQWAGFFAGGRLKTVSLSGGAPVTLADAPTPRGATWGPDDAIYFSPATDTGLMRVPASGGAPQAVTTPDSGRGERSHRWPEMLPGGKAILLTIAYSDILSFDDARVAVLSLETGKLTELIKGGSYGRFVAPDHLLYCRAGAVLSVPLDPKRNAVTGPSATVLDGVVTYPLTGAAQFAVSEAGSLAFLPGGSTEAKRTLTWVDRQGRATPAGPEPAAFQTLQISPDGRSVALDIDGANANIWIHEFGRGGMTRLTLEWSNNGGVWTPDGTRIVFSSARGGRRNLFWQASDGSGKAEPLTSADRLQTGASWSPDGKLLLFTEQNPRGGRDLWVLDRERGTPRAFLQTPFDEFAANFSPDGRFIAYVSDEAGQAEVYVQPFPGPGRKWRISTDGGSLPVWARSGRELFYRRGDAMMSVEVTTAPSFAVKTPRALFKYTSSSAFDVSPDGQRFLMIGAVPDPASAAIEVVVDWFSDRERRTPARR